MSAAMHAARRRRPVARAPFLRTIVSRPGTADAGTYPFNISAFSRGIDLTFRSAVTFFVGENGSGKSTLLEAIAECCGFNPEGGGRDHHRETVAGTHTLARALTGRREIDTAAEGGRR